MNFLSCTSSDDVTETEIKCGFDSENRQLYKGPRDGCYYKENGEKKYVNKDECNC